MLRPTAIIPALCCAAALCLACLCLTAGHKKDFMEDYHLMTLNTSRIGENLLNTTVSGDNPISNLLNDIGDNISGEVNEEISEIQTKLGIEDFYSAHILDYCYGQYTPTESANATVAQSDIHKNVRGCSNQTAMFAFNPTEILEQALNRSGLDVTLDDLEWPSDIQRGIDALRIIMITAFVLYCIAIALTALSFVLAVLAIFLSGRLTACLNVMLSILAFLAFGLASALVTAALVKGADVVNKYGNEIGVQANRGNKFLVLTWVGTALMFVVLVWWCLEFCIGHRKKRAAYTPKHG